MRPPEARTKPKVSAFINARFDKIEALNPDLVLAFSDLQADIAAELIRRGYPVVTFNQRSVAEILQTIRLIGGLVGAARARRRARVAGWRRGSTTSARAAALLPRRPRVFFEEWDDPLISGIRWVDELVEIAGGTCLFPELRTGRLAKDRIVAPELVAAADPEVIIASWCGKAVKKRTITERPGWDRVCGRAQRPRLRDRVHLILQPGPASLTEGVRQLHDASGEALDANLVPGSAF